MPKGSVRNDRRPQSWGARKLHPPQGEHAEGTPTPRRRNRKEPDSKVSQNNSSLAQIGSFGDREVNEDHPARFGPRCVFVHFHESGNDFLTVRHLFDHHPSQFSVNLAAYFFQFFLPGLQNHNILFVSGFFHFSQDIEDHPVDRF